jgi:hypothetical protein
VKHDDKERDKDDPNLEHLRGEVTGAPGSLLVKTIYESRGVRDLAIEVFNNPRLTLASALMKETPEDTNAMLFKGANHWLQQSGERDFFGVAELADAAKREAGEADSQTIDDVTFAAWSSSVGERQGYLSPAGIAAHFIASSDYLHRRVGDNPDLLKAIYAFANAWHWAHFEGKGEHSLAALGVATMQDRAAGPAAVRRQKEQKDRITQDAFNSFASDKRNEAAMRSPKGVAGGLLPVVNDVLKAMKLRPYSLSSLEKVVRPMLELHKKSSA